MTFHNRPGKKAPKGPKRDKSKKPPSKDSMEALVPNKLTDKQVNERGALIARKVVELAGLNRRKKNAVRTINADIKEVQAVIDKLAEEVVHGEEMLRQGDLFAPASKVAGSEKPSPDKAKEILKEIGQRSGEGKAAEATA